MTDEQAREKAARNSCIRLPGYVDMTGAEVQALEIDAFKSGWHAALHGPAVTALLDALKVAIHQMEYTDLLDVTGNKTNHPTIEIFLKPAIEEFNKARGTE